jgi:thiamine biosynthesis lipoprotein ApbE
VAASSAYATAAVAAALSLIPSFPRATAREGPTGADRTREYRYVMGTSVEIEAVGATPDVRSAAITEAFAAFAEVDRLMSDYRSDSELSGVNQRAAGQPVRVSDALFSVLHAADVVSLRSHGAFDVTVGPLVALWGFHDKKPHLPAPSELATVRPLVDYRNVVLDASRQTVRFLRPGVAIDLGGIAKGFAVELAAGVLRRHGLNGFIDAGGNQYLLGLPAGKPQWTVGVKDPTRRDRLLGVIDTLETSVSTSADNANFLTANGVTYGHILDPHTLHPSDAALSVTVLSRDGTLADALSKAAFVLGPKAGIELIDSFPGMSAVVAYRTPGGGVAVAASSSLAHAFRRSAG